MMTKKTCFRWTLMLGGLLLNCAVFAGTAADCSATDKVAAADCQRAFADWWHGDKATGDWGGARTELEDNGVNFFAAAESNPAGNPVGGRTHGFTYVSSIEFGVKLDMEKLAGWRGASILARGIYREGENLSGRYIGNFFTVQQVYGVQTVVLQSLAVEQKFLRDSWSVKAGRVAVGDDFARSPVYGLYMSNAEDGTPKSIAASGAFSCYPGAVWGARVSYSDPNKQWYAKFGVYQADDRIYLPNKHGVDFGVRDNDGVTLIAESGWTPTVSGMPGHYWMGGYISLWDVPQFNRAETYDKYYMLYWHADQMVYQAAPGTDQGLSVWALFNLAPQQNVSLMPYQVAAGAFYKGLLPGRERDTLMVGVTHGWFSRDYAAQQKALGQGDPGAETVVEVGYRVQLANFFFVQPNVQYVFDPFGDARIPDALVLGARLGVVF